MNLDEVRREYGREALDEATVDPDPVQQFDRWLEAARAAGVPEPNAMTLATADARGSPDARIVLLKGFGEDGFVFFTDYRSRKGRQLGENGRAALLFYWGALERQVRILGPVDRVPQSVSEEYFRTRPLGSRLGAWASHQSASLPGGREELDAALAEVSARFAGVAVPLPPHWGGFCLMPEEFEFWQGRENRLHDRIRYLRRNAAWTLDRLAP